MDIMNVERFRGRGRRASSVAARGRRRVKRAAYL